jgi:beta-glucosidase
MKKQNQKKKKSIVQNVLFIISCMILIVVLGSFVSEKKPAKYPYQDSGLPIEKRIADLIKRMTVEEKIQQLDMYKGVEVTDMDNHDASNFSETKIEKTLGKLSIGSVHDLYPLDAETANKIQQYAIEKTRLGIPILFIEEGLHGFEGVGSTCFPIPLSLASTWDTAMVYQIGRVIATEARSRGVHMILGPVLCLARDPRWGRVEETYGEDNYLAARNGVAMVRGLQGKSLKDQNTVISEPKHFAVHGIPEGGSNTSPVNVGEREARSSYLYVFEKAIREGGAMAMMAAYSELDGIPCVDNKWLLTDVLRKEWGFKGFVLSDLGAIKMTVENHKVAADASDALSQTFKAGLNMQFYDFTHSEFKIAIMQALKNNMLSENELDKTVSDVLRVKFMLGLFDNPYTDVSLKSKVYRTQENQNLALKAGQESICLLKNNNSLLPLNILNQSVAVIGPMAKSTFTGGYSPEGEIGVSVLEGLKQRAGNTLQINFEDGYSSDNSQAVQSGLLKKAVDLVNKSDVAILVLGEDVKFVGEGKDRANLDLDDQQMSTVKAIYETGKPVVVVLANGRPLSINWIAKNIPAIIESWRAGEKGGLAIADVILGKVNPSGKLPITFPRSVGQLPFYYDHKPTSRHQYVDEANSPLYPFGHGLSYTTFEYSDLQVTPSKIPVNGTAEINVKIKNTGAVEGTEVVQLYIRDVLSSVTTPVMSLKGFSRVTLKPGESKTVNVKVGPEQLSLWNREMKRVVEPGEFKIMVGSSSADIRQQGSLWVSKN